MTNQSDLDMVHLRLILVSGKTQDFTFSPNDSATDIAKHVFDNWPEGWEEERVSSPSILRLIFQGRFLHGNVTLGVRRLALFGPRAAVRPKALDLVIKELCSKTATGPNNCHALGCQGDSSRAKLSWSKEQRKNHREQLLPPPVEQQEYTSLPAAQMSHKQNTHIQTCSNSRNLISCRSGINRRTSSWGFQSFCVELFSNLRLFCANIYPFSPPTCQH